MVFLFPIIFAPRPEGERQPQPSALTEFVMDTTVKSDFAFWTATKLARGGTGSKGVYIGPSGKNAEYHQCHIVVLGSASGERLCGGQDSGHRFKSRQVVTGFGKLDQSIFAPLFVAGVRGFRDSVREEHDQVSRFKRKRFLLIALP